MGILYIHPWKLTYIAPKKGDDFSSEIPLHQPMDSSEAKPNRPSRIGRISRSLWYLDPKKNMKGSNQKKVVPNKQDLKLIEFDPGDLGWLSKFTLPEKTNEILFDPGDFLGDSFGIQLG